LERSKLLASATFRVCGVSQADDVNFKQSHYGVVADAGAVGGASGEAAGAGVAGAAVGAASGTAGGGNDGVPSKSQTTAIAKTAPPTIGSILLLIGCSQTSKSFHGTPQIMTDRRDDDENLAFDIKLALSKSELPQWQW
jgi:hypothetical protein